MWLTADQGDRAMDLLWNRWIGQRAYAFEIIQIFELSFVLFNLTKRFTKAHKQIVSKQGQNDRRQVFVEN